MPNQDNLWSIKFANERVKRKAERFCGRDKVIRNKWKSFERDVSINPYRHHETKTIAELGFKSIGLEEPLKSYRYRRDPLRVLYVIKNESKTIFIYEVARANDTSYKRRSKR